MKHDKEVYEFICDLIAENCIECDQFGRDRCASQCICVNIAAAILEESGAGNELKYVACWDAVRKDIVED
jgi:hypothetical protein